MRVQRGRRDPLQFREHSLDVGGLSQLWEEALSWHQPWSYVRWAQASRVWLCKQWEKNKGILISLFCLDWQEVSSWN